MSVTAIVRTFFENVSSKQKQLSPGSSTHSRSRDSAELEDSGFQVSFRHSNLSILLSLIIQSPQAGMLF